MIHFWAIALFNTCSYFIEWFTILLVKTLMLLFWDYYTSGQMSWYIFGCWWNSIFTTLSDITHVTICGNLSKKSIQVTHRRFFLPEIASDTWQGVREIIGGHRLLKILINGQVVLRAASRRNLRAQCLLVSKLHVLTIITDPRQSKTKKRPGCSNAEMKITEISFRRIS